MNIAQDLAEAYFVTTVYKSVVGEIFFETQFENGVPVTTLFVKYPDGCASEVQNLQEAYEALEL